MAGPEKAAGRVAKTVAKYGMRYGPIVFEAVKHGREPAQRAVEKALARKRDRRTAVQHAGSVREGSVLRVFDDGQPLWVVFSGETPVASYPKVDVPLEKLIEYADLGQRVPVGPEALRSFPDRVADKLPDPVRGVARKALRRNRDSSS